jgi:hypothetical protein
MLGFPEETRAERMAALSDLPTNLLLVLEDGQEVVPEVDRGYTGGSDRLPAVLGLRYLIPLGNHPVALRSRHLEATGSFPAPPSWGRWVPGSRVLAAQEVS